MRGKSRTRTLEYVIEGMRPVPSVSTEDTTGEPKIDVRGTDNYRDPYSFLYLPLEVPGIIYNYILRQRLIHIVRKAKGGWDSPECPELRGRIYQALCHVKCSSFDTTRDTMTDCGCRDALYRRKALFSSRIRNRLKLFRFFKACRKTCKEARPPHLPPKSLRN